MYNRCFVVPCCRGGIQYSGNKGQYFNASVGGGDSISAAAVTGTIPGLGFGSAGQFPNSDGSTTNGVSVSMDGGLTFTNYDAALNASARYVSFPSPTVWFVSSGDFPQPASDDQPSDQTTTGTGSTTTTGGTGSTTGTTTGGKNTPSKMYRSRRISAFLEVETTRDGTRQVFHRPTTAQRVVSSRSMQAAQYDGQLSRTTDGGNTWTSLFYTTNLYFNGIACVDTNHCCAVGEADAGATAGAYTYCSSDGKTFNNTRFDNSACGGNVGNTTISASFLHTTDNGQVRTARCNHG
jgi:hypothetical protein